MASPVDSAVLLAVAIQVPVQGPSVAQMTFQRELLITGDEDELFYAGGPSLFDCELDDRLVHDWAQFAKPRQRIAVVRTRTGDPCDGKRSLIGNLRLPVRALVWPAGVPPEGTNGRVRANLHFGADIEAGQLNGLDDTRMPTSKSHQSAATQGKLPAAPGGRQIAADESPARPRLTSQWSAPLWPDRLRIRI